MGKITTMNLNERNIQLESKPVKCEEFEGWTGWVEEDGTVVAKKIHHDSVHERMSKFHDKHCCSCDNELCYDVYDEHGRDVCELYNEEFNCK